MEKEVLIGDKKYIVKEITYLQALELDGLNKVDVAKKLLNQSIGLTDDEISKLSIVDGITLQKTINDINNFSGIEDFQKPGEEKTS